MITYSTLLYRQQHRTSSWRNVLHNYKIFNNILRNSSINVFNCADSFLPSAYVVRREGSVFADVCLFFQGGLQSLGPDFFSSLWSQVLPGGGGTYLTSGPKSSFQGWGRVGGKGYPHPSTWLGYFPYPPAQLPGQDQDRGIWHLSSYPQVRTRTGSTPSPAHFGPQTAGGRPLAVTQENFLVRNVFLKFDQQDEIPQDEIGFNFTSC